MNEFSTLQTLRSDVQTPSDEQLAPAFAKLSAEMSRKPWHRPVMRTSWFIAAAGAATAVALIAGNLNTATVAPAEASVVLMQAAENIEIGTDPTVGPNQYLQITYTSNIEVFGDDGMPVPAQRVSEIFKPGDSSKLWVETMKEPNILDPSKTDYWVIASEETALQFHGSFGAGTMVNFAEMPHTNGADALDYVEQEITTYSEENYGSAEQDSWVQTQMLIEIFGYLGKGFASAEDREVLYQALATVDTVSSTDDVQNASGQSGVAIGHTYTKEDDNGKVVEKLRTEIIIDPKTGAMLGTRTLDLFGSEEGVVIYNETVATQIVDKTPEPNISSLSDMYPMPE